MAGTTVMRTAVALLGAAVAWMVHLNASYAVVALGCAAVVARPGPWLVVVTAACTVVALISGVVAVRDWLDARRLGRDRQRVLMSVGALSALVFVVAILFEGAAPAAVPACPPA
jgi:hypothetical protein